MNLQKEKPDIKRKESERRVEIAHMQILMRRYPKKAKEIVKEIEEKRN